MCVLVCLSVCTVCLQLSVWIVQNCACACVSVCLSLSVCVCPVCLNLSLSVCVLTFLRTVCVHVCVGYLLSWCLVPWGESLPCSWYISLLSFLMRSCCLSLCNLRCSSFRRVPCGIKHCILGLSIAPVPVTLSLGCLPSVCVCVSVTKQHPHWWFRTSDTVLNNDKMLTPPPEPSLLPSLTRRWTICQRSAVEMRTATATGCLAGCGQQVEAQQVVINTRGHSALGPALISTLKAHRVSRAVL